jgi:Tol biopolymer transport system component
MAAPSMQLAPGTRLGPYEILSSLGAGGMGEVYRGRDTRLDRPVAIKILPQAFAADADRTERFEREARLVAALSHPNICALHDVGTTPVGGQDVAYLVMEHLEGETLAERLARGALPANEAIALAAQIARGLDAAHRRRIVHRDLKPSNIMLTRTGVKLLDFGLAKTVDPAGITAGSTIAATAMTSPGAVLGTVPYMAPEQIEGRPVDARADIFALGAVVHEMVTGRRAFSGESPAAVASAILSSNPPALTASPGLDRIVRTCLRKDPDERWQSAQDVALQFAMLGDANDDAATPTVAPARRGWTVALASALLLVTALAAWSVTQRPDTPAAPATPVAFTIPPPDGGQFFLTVESTFVAVSPDGTSIAYVASVGSGRAALWLRPLSSTTARLVPGTEGASSAFWSPDGRALAFFAGGSLKRVDLAGGAPVTLCATRAGAGHTGTWSRDGQILFASVSGEGIMRVSADGGTPEVARLPDQTSGEERVAWPSFLPDGRSYLYVAGRGDQTGRVMLARPDGDPVEVVAQRSKAEYVEPGFIVFAQDSTLIARRFDVATGRISGTPIPLAERVFSLTTTAVAQFSASVSGVIALTPHRDEARIAAFDRSGRETAEIRPAGSYVSLRLSPDGREMLFDRLNAKDAAYDIWLLDLERGVDTPVTTATGSEIWPAWVGDGSVIYSASRGVTPRLHRRGQGSTDERPLISTKGPMQVQPDVSRDGQHLVFSERSDVGFQLFWMPMAGGAPQRLHPSVNAQEQSARFSPDARYIAYASDEAGRRDIYVEPFKATGGRRIVSVAGGHSPRWSRDGRELYFLAPSGEVMSAKIGTDPLRIEHPVPLFKPPARWLEYDVTADGRFIAILSTQLAAERPLTVLVGPLR